MSDLWFRLFVSLWACLCGLYRDYPGCYARLFNRAVRTWLFLACTIVVVNVYLDSRLWLLYVASLPAISAALHRWYYPWLDRREMRRDA